jgi:hypothetical protein
MQECHRHTRVCRVDDRPLPLDEDQVKLGGRRSDRSLDCARGEVRDDPVDDDARPGDHHPGLAGGDDPNVDPCCQGRIAQCHGCGHLARRAVTPDCEYDPAGSGMLLTRRHLEIFGGCTDVPEAYACSLSTCGDRGIVTQVIMQPCPDVATRFDGVEDSRT